MPRPTASAVIFAINAAIRLGRNMQQAFAQRVRAQAITLPLPNVSLEADLDSAFRYFNIQHPQKGGAQFLSEIVDLQQLHDRAFYD